jgi:hypothetical protein
MVLALTQNHTMTKKEQNAKIAREMRQHITSWQNRKISSRKYCSENGLSVPKFYYWLNKIRKEQPLTGSTSGGFLRVRPKAGPSTAQIHGDATRPSMEVNLPNGTRLVFYHAISNDLLNLFL